MSALAGKCSVITFMQHLAPGRIVKEIQGFIRFSVNHKILRGAQQRIPGARCFDHRGHWKTQGIPMVFNGVQVRFPAVRRERRGADVARCRRRMLETMLLPRF